MSRPGVDLRISARDGYALAATKYEPAGEGLGVAVGIHSATAVPRRYYDAFARFLAGRGLHAVTYDYRGIGDSAPKSLRGFEATAADWALQDMAGVVDWIESEWSPQRIGHVGHSFGGQTMGLLPNADRIDAMVAVSSQSGYWRLQPGMDAWAVGFHMHVTMPLLASLLGYVPWSAFSRAEDLPRGVARQWSRWCRSPDYLFDDPTLPAERYRGIHAPVLAYSIEDDAWGSARAVDALMRHYPDVTRRHLVPAQAGVPALGHFGWFRERSQSLWPEAADWLISAKATTST